MLTPMKPRYPQQDFAARLREAIDDAGITQADLARKCGVSDQAVYDWLKTGRVGKQHLPMICAATGKGYEFFLTNLKMLRRVAVIALLALLAPQINDTHAAGSPLVAGVYYVKWIIAILRALRLVPVCETRSYCVLSDKPA